jgi:NAD(P)-dependent dehydrogenase (short-subunit alcohol dehydrogenase family)
MASLCWSGRAISNAARLRPRRFELESTGIKVNAVSPGFTKTNRNNYAGTETVEDGTAEALRVALLGPDGPTGTFTHAKLGTLPW